VPNQIRPGKSIEKNQTKPEWFGDEGAKHEREKEKKKECKTNPESYSGDREGVPSQS
jgi:hypothetical protein